MKICKVCKNEITATDAVMEENESIHKNGACDVYFIENMNKITESTEQNQYISETQLL